MADADASRPGDFVRSLERGLSVLRAFDASHAELTLSEVARRTDLSRAAARRFLLTLASLGYAYLSALGLADLAAPHVEALVARLHESSSVAVLDGEDVVYVVRVPTQRIMTVTIAVGTRFPAYATALGRVLLAGLDPDELDAYLDHVDLVALTRRTVTDPAALRRIVDGVRNAGYAVVDQELEDGLRSLAVPLADGRGRVAGALNTSAHATRTTLDRLRRLVLPEVLATAARIDADLAAVPAPRRR